MQALYVVLHRAHLAQFLQLLPCLLFLCDGGEGRSYLPSELPPVRPGCPVTRVDTGLLRPKRALGTFLQLSTSNIDPLV